MATVFVKIFKENFFLKKFTYCTVVVVTFQKEGGESFVLL